MNWSIVKINNAALAMVGCQSIVSLDDQTPEALKCKVFWDLTHEYVLGVHPWKCIAKQAELTTTTTAPAFGFSYAYPVPADFVRMVSMDDSDDAYHVAGRTLHTDDLPARIWYVPRGADITLYDATLVQALVLQQAYMLAGGIRQDKDLATMILQHMERFFLPVIRHADASRRGVRTISQHTMTDMFRD